MKMFETGCALSFKCGEQEGTGSGILIDTIHGLVVTHGTLVTSVLSDKQMFVLSTEGILQNCFDSWSVDVILQPSKEQEDSKKVKRYQSTVLNTSEISRTIESKSVLKNNLFLDYSASVISIFQLKRLVNIVSFLMPPEKWEYVEDFAKQEKPDDQSRFHPLLSCFILLELHNWKSYSRDLPLLRFAQLEKGDNLEIEATPFGGLSPEIFLNSRSNGIVSNKAGGVLLMTDARCVPGSEGGPVFCWHGNKRYLVGIVIASLCWRCNEWVGLSMACTITDVLNNVKQISKIDSLHGHIANKVSRSNICKIIGSVPMIVVGSNWGSGVVIGRLNDDTSLLLTCSHVVRESGYNTVKVKFTDRQKPVKATVIYKTPSEGQFDIAVLSVPNSKLSPIPLLSSPVSQGDTVYVIGHAIFGEDKNLEPTITSGIISKVTRINDVPVMIQTTCAVHAGASGGAVVDKYGRLVGITVSNAKDTESKASYPHVNMCVPMETVVPTLKCYMSTKDVSVLKHLHLKNKNVQRLWSLEKIMTASKL